MEYTLLIEVTESLDDCYKFFKSGKLTFERKTDSRIEQSWNHIPMLSLHSCSNKVSIESEWCGHGIIRLFKNGHASVGTFDDKELYRELGDGRMLAILFIPNYLTINRLLGWFIGEETTNQVTHLQLIKMNKEKGRFMLLMKFKEQSLAKEFQKLFDGKKFNEIDPETCHVVAIKELIFHQGMFSEDKDALPYMLKYPFTQSSSEQSDGLIELPMCPVCLEKLDSEVTGLVTTPCQHTFHCKCLDQWKNGNCPVCRYSQLKDVNNEPLPRCLECGETNNLWICLICGHLGCGRYNSQHAICHYEQSNHCFAMDLTTKRVWDYAGDNYVHRIVQNEIDGKLVEVGESHDGSNTKRNKEYHLEYVQVLLSQLESQREYYEGQIYNMHERVKSLESDMQVSRQKDDHKQLKKLVEESMQEMKNRLKEEMLLNSGLQQNLDHLTKQMEKFSLEKQKLQDENQELQSQIQDLMFHFESQEKFAEDSELQNATLVLQPPPGSEASSSAKNKKKKKKKIPKIPKI
ncbi:Etp1p [Kluyveromyces lactis]|uniref:KLLA0F25740p n=1 Tax=Kluyveromyces lactis (strain ATCC 8585 / CBS 2359 / DSM 70799 / NBRC 1267 / NRRL Y-1140 / WM37) TaxID=284590 RepID=Q6CIL3_KLULA|nr:uncharacterized protein KLLA0_F25740g [Kluyveromyces lactis]CAG98934.1 KLLA0F25740p [Kluyveromyces lactis]|eukprot:XP_456226.1 uncharacterized protein KLLA0_F25740g [Kluyveromyces lactis]